jgi:hypothetical protein
MPTIAEYLKYANLQMAAEAFLNDPDTGDKNYSGTALKDALVRGNLDTPPNSPKPKRSSSLPNGKSSTNSRTRQLAFPEHSSRTTKPANSSSASARPSLLTTRSATARPRTRWRSSTPAGPSGQISDMEAWYKTHQWCAALARPFSVTGYSLGGHLATAFNLRREDAGRWRNRSSPSTAPASASSKEGHTLQGVLDYFNDPAREPDEHQGRARPDAYRAG